MIERWEDINRFYAELTPSAPWLEPMANLTKQIEKSPTVRRLFGWTSMHDLIVVQTPVSYPYDGPRLLISPSQDGSIEFRYIDTQIASRQWRRTAPRDDAFRALERFIDQLRWFPRVSGQGS